MNRSEWATIVAEMQARWPHAVIGEATVAAWWQDVADLDAQDVLETMRALGRDGREFPPTGGMLRSKLVELSQDAADAMEAWRLAMEAIRRHSSYDREGGLAALAEVSPAIAEAVRRFGWQELCTFNLADQNTVRAQFRDTYRAVVCAERRGAAYSGLTIAASKPRRELRKPDYRAAIEEAS